MWSYFLRLRFWLFFLNLETEGKTVVGSNPEARPGPDDKVESRQSVDVVRGYREGVGRVLSSR